MTDNVTYLNNANMQPIVDAIWDAIGDGTNAPTTPGEVLTNIGVSTAMQPVVESSTTDDALTALGLDASKVPFTPSGTGAVASTVQTRFLSPKQLYLKADFGAKIDGTTDDSTAVVNAFAALSDGAELVIEPTGSKCIVKQAISCATSHLKVTAPGIESGTWLDFQSMAAADALTFTGYDYHITDLFLGSSDSSTGNGIAFARSGSTALDVTCERVYSYNHGTNGFVIARPQQVNLIGCRALYNGASGFNLDGSLAGGGGGTNTNLWNCWADQNGLYGLRAKTIAGFGVIGGQYSNSSDYAAYISYCDAVEIGGGIDMEAAHNGGIFADGNTHGVKLGVIFLSLVDAGKYGILLNGTKGHCSIDGVEFESITGYHLSAPGVERLEMVRWSDRDQTDKQALRYGSMASAKVFYPTLHGASHSFADAAVVAAATANERFIGVPSGYYYCVESANLYTDGGTDSSVIVRDQTGGNDILTVTANANNCGYSEPGTFVPSGGDRQLILRAKNANASTPHIIHGAAVVKLVPYVT